MTTISDLWDSLDSAVQQWLLDNPATRMLPRLQVNQVPAGGAETGQCLRLDEHGDYWLTPDEMMFVQAKREELALHEPQTTNAGGGRDGLDRPEEGLER